MQQTPKTTCPRKRRHPDALMEELTSDVVLDKAYAWVCKRRKDYGHNACVWDLRFWWELERESLKRDLRAGVYRFAIMTRYVRESGEEIELWSARDSLVLKALALVLGGVLQIPESCVHVKGRGTHGYSLHGSCPRGARRPRSGTRSGRTGAHRRGHPLHSHACKSPRTPTPPHADRLRQVVYRYEGYSRPVSVKDRGVLSLLWQSMQRSSERGGVMRVHSRGIPLGSPLSPLLGAFFLAEVDRSLEGQRVFYVRYMDDLLVLAKTRWRLRKAVKAINQGFSALGVVKHPDKTFIGRIRKGFDFLGYRFGEGALGLAGKTVENFKEKCSRLYEQKGHLPEWVRPLRAITNVGGAGAQPVSTRKP